MVVVNPKPKKPKSKKDLKSNTDDIIIKSTKTGEILAQYDDELIQTLIDTVAKNATRSELIMFLSVANECGLNPFLHEIWFTKLKGEPVIMTSRDGYVRIVKNNPLFEKLQSSAVYENDDFKISWKDGELASLEHTHGVKDRGECIGAWATLKYHNMKPISIYVAREEYDKKQSVWKSNPSAMIRKVAEKEVCRLGEGISGLYIEEEMPQEYSLNSVLSDNKTVEQKPIDDITDDVIEIDYKNKE